MVRDAVEPFLTEAKDKGVTLTMTVPDDLPNILGDSKRLQHVLANLLSNALRFTNPGGSVSVRAEAEPAMVRFAVTDSGRGIESEHLGRLFEPFYRVPGQDRPTGVGLGLAIVKEIVKAHSGSVGVTSEPGKGSTFWFTLPQDAGAETPAVDVASRR